MNKAIKSLITDISEENKTRYKNFKKLKGLTPIIYRHQSNNQVILS